MTQAELSYRNWTHILELGLSSAAGSFRAGCLCILVGVGLTPCGGITSHRLLLKRKFNRVDFKGVIDIIQPWDEAASHLTSGKEC